MIDPIDTEREPVKDLGEARIFPNPVVPVGTGSISVNPGIIPGIAIGTDPADVVGRGSDESDPEWHYKTQDEVHTEHRFGPGGDPETPLDAADLAAQESEASRTDAEEG